MLACELAHRHRPTVFDALIAEESLDGVDAHRFVEAHAVARTLAGVITDAAHDGGQRIVLHDLPPGSLVISLFRMAEPRLDVFACRAGVVAWRQTVQVDRPFGTPGARLVEQAGADIKGNGERLGLNNGFGPHA
ncbi:MAG: hypothetical protein QF598_06850 [Arenicellales bacterium]|nr:hypothetical protein [Arenicellales bacterium]